MYTKTELEVIRKQFDQSFKTVKVPEGVVDFDEASAATQCLGIIVEDYLKNRIDDGSFQELVTECALFDVETIELDLLGMHEYVLAKLGSLIDRAELRGQSATPTAPKPGYGDDIPLGYTNVNINDFIGGGDK
ncbi:MAG: hypothetical protein KKH61_21455 [Gammaproteobacteria bacterium]|uniref:Uncharacterized protein n=1 Tax=viral metagenome TaxID=1070528 RepID=A0A6H1ZB69_9ZZZZ|nr:hypothetical protein [Gammaproteobacteria bacterium]